MKDHGKTCCAHRISITFVSKKGFGRGQSYRKKIEERGGGMAVRGKMRGLRNYFNTTQRVQQVKGETPEEAYEGC